MNNKTALQEGTSYLEPVRKINNNISIKSKNVQRTDIGNVI